MHYGYPLEFGLFITPRADEPKITVSPAKLSESLGSDLVTFQDHPYQPSFLDAWALLAWVAGQTEREPAEIRRFLNIAGRFAPTGRSLLSWPPRQWAEELAAMTLDYGIAGFIFAADDAVTIERFAAEVAPATRELVAAERGLPFSARSG